MAVTCCFLPLKPLRVARWAPRFARSPSRSVCLFCCCWWCMFFIMTSVGYVSAEVVFKSQLFRRHFSIPWSSWRTWSFTRQIFSSCSSWASWWIVIKMNIERWVETGEVTKPFNLQPDLNKPVLLKRRTPQITKNKRQMTNKFQITIFTWSLNWVKQNPKLFDSPHSVLNWCAFSSV